MNGTAEPTYEVLPSHQSDPFRDHVVRAYEDSPADWQKVIGEQLHFQWGAFDHPDAPRPVSLDEAGLRYLEQQLALATGERPGHTRLRRILDVGCGWGATLRHLAQFFPDCPRLDGVNISAEQLTYCAGLVRDVPRPGSRHAPPSSGVRDRDRGALPAHAAGVAARRLRDALQRGVAGP
ncbi:hypothetical protein GTY20_20960 [Streptomyces sp. SID4946]|nr:hypothetical protein [Streptomyces sp. SID4946]